MNKNRGFVRLAQVLVFGTALLGSSLSSEAAENNITRTNWTERWITNLIEVRMPKNIFVDEFHTNWLTETVTNTIPIQATRTVRMTEYKTNWSTVVLTNRVPVNMARTNFVELWQTNWRTMTLTNWTTVLVMKTNWVNQPVTNVVQIDLITNRLAPTEVAAVKPVIVQDAPIQPVPSVTSTLTESLQFEASRTSRPSNRNSFELQLRVRWVNDPNAQLQVRQWKVESEDGAILCASQDQDFKRELPIGRYRIEVKAQQDANSPLLAARGVVALSAANAVVLPLASLRK